MREDEISRYTADSDVLDMMDFRDIPADELAGTEAGWQCTRKKMQAECWRSCKRCEDKGPYASE